MTDLQTFLPETEVESPPKTVDEMSLEEFIRWMCLIQAVEVISNKAEKLGLDLDSSISLKSSMISSYIDEIFPSMRANYILDHAQLDQYPP